MKEPHFNVFPEFHGASYAKRYEVFLTKLLRERLYDGACVLLSKRREGLKGKFTTPSQELTFRKFAAGLAGHALAYAHSR